MKPIKSISEKTISHTNRLQVNTTLYGKNEMIVLPEIAYGDVKMGNPSEIVLECIESEIDNINRNITTLDDFAASVIRELERMYTITPDIPPELSAFEVDSNGKTLYPIATPSKVEAYERFNSSMVELGWSVAFLSAEDIKEYQEDGYEVEL